MDTNLYVAIIIYESTSPSPEYRTLYEEEISLIEADSEEQAREKAFVHGKAQETTYKNQYGETLTVTFKTLVDVQQVLDSDFRDGSLLYARHFRDYEAYEAFEPLLKGEEL